MRNTAKPTWPSRASAAASGVSVRPLYREEVVLAIDPALLESVTGVGAARDRDDRGGKGSKSLASCPFLLERIDDISGRVARHELQSAGIKPVGFCGILRT